MHFRLALGLIVSTIAVADVTVDSPNGQLKMTFRTSDTGRLTYSVAYKTRPLITDSALLLHLKGRPPLGENVAITTANATAGEDNYRLLSGKTSSVRERYRALHLEAAERGDKARTFAIEARVYDNAVAFRYVVPKQPALEDFQLEKETTEFRFAKDPFIWALFLPNFRSMYESEFIHLSASSLSNQGGVKSTQLLGLPLLADVPGVGWVAIAEADVRDYPAMYLVNPSGSWTGHWFVSTLAPHIDDATIAVTGALPHESAWRVLMVGDQPGRLIESNVLTSLNPESTLKDTAWIKPGKAAWDWWSGSLDRNGKPAYTTENMKWYVDFAAQAGLEYMLVDAGWSGRDITRMNGKIDIPELVKYAAAKKVRIWIWLIYSSTATQMEEAFALYEQWGVAGVKIDFIERDDQEGMNWYTRVAECAARHRIMVDFHGSTKPSGLDRTWPNVVGYEAVSGMEQSKAGSRDNPDLHVTLPFTRMLVGPMDYTPGSFRNATRESFEARMQSPMVMGTRAHQLAMYVVFEAAIQMVSDHPGAYQGQPEFAFIQAAPASWDETRVLSGTPGESITIARRKGREWFLGAMTNWTSREADVALSFLGTGKYRAEIYSDAPDADQAPQHVAIMQKTVDASGRLKVRLASGGGLAVRFVPLGAK